MRPVRSFRLPQNLFAMTFKDPSQPDPGPESEILLKEFFKIARRLPRKKVYYKSGNTWNIERVLFGSRLVPIPHYK
jgi:hypothetical protein